MGYTVSVSECEKYVRIRPHVDVSKELALNYMRDAVDLGGMRKIRKILVDVRGVRSVSAVSDKYSFAYVEARGVGLDWSWKWAMVKDDGDPTPDFLAVVVKNAGYSFKLFTDENAAVRWLDKPHFLKQAG